MTPYFVNNKKVYIKIKLILTGKDHKLMDYSNIIKVIKAKKFQQILMLVYHLKVTVLEIRIIK